MQARWIGFCFLGGRYAANSDLGILQEMLNRFGQGVGESSDGATSRIWEFFESVGWGWLVYGCVLVCWM